MWQKWKTFITLMLFVCMTPPPHLNFSLSIVYLPVCVVMIDIMCAHAQNVVSRWERSILGYEKERVTVEIKDSCGLDKLTKTTQWNIRQTCGWYNRIVQ